MKTEKEIISLLTDIKDPEIPVLNIIELGIIREVHYEDDLLIVNITPTYSGCPAMETMKQDINSTLLQNGIQKFKVNIIYSPAWTTDWLSESALKKLKVYGIAPPSKLNQDTLTVTEEENIICPYCNSGKTEIKSFFGSTACKSLYYCNNCNQPFEHFKKF